MKKWRIAGINFDHFHMGDLLRMVHEHPDAELVGISDEFPERMVSATKNFGLSPDQVFTDYRACLEQTKPDLVILCPAASHHGDWVEKVAPYGVHVIMEKPFAASLEEADRMIAAMKPTGKQLIINWPLVWEESMVTAYRLIKEGVIGKVVEYHHYGGNRGPLYHGADKMENEPTAADKDASWFYKRNQGGGSLFDYLGYGTTLGTWFVDGAKPLEVTCVTDEPNGLEVDEHSIVIVKYAFGLSKCETRWGTFTDPWTHRPQPNCGFVLKGTEGTIAACDYGTTIRVQTKACPEGFEASSDVLKPPFQNPVQYVLHCLGSGVSVEGPLSLEISRTGQQIVDTAYRSAQEKRTLKLIE